MGAERMMADQMDLASYWIRRFTKLETRHANLRRIVDRWAAAELALQAANEAHAGEWQSDLMASQGSMDAKHKPTIHRVRSELEDATAALLEAVKETQQ